MSLKKLLSSWWAEILLLAGISALVYLPYAGKLSFNSDDWYFIYNGLVRGPMAFIDLALHTRPIRGPLYQFLFGLFGLHPTPYILLLYTWRLLSGYGALWLFHMLWPGKRRENFFLAVLLVVYPGFLWWISGFEFQPYILSLVLQIFSIIFTLKAVGSDRWWKWGLWALAAFISGWVYLALVEFAIGMEAFRIIAVMIYLRNSKAFNGSFRQLSISTIKSSAFFLTIPLSFVFWYQFLFDNYRKAQQADVQIGRVIQDPIAVINWLVRFLQGMVNVPLGAWIMPFSSNYFSGSPRELVVAIGYAILVIALGVLAFLALGRDAEVGGGWQLEMLGAGLLGTAAGIIPIVVANRTLTFNFSQYLLPASLAGVLVLGSFLFSLPRPRLQILALSVVLGLTTLSQQSIAYNAIKGQHDIVNFWWQVTWRAPGISDGATILAEYPFNVGGNYALVWGPANFIYYPQPHTESPINLHVNALTHQPDTIKNLMLGGKGIKNSEIISNTLKHYDFNNMLIMNMLESTSCVRILNPAWLEFSSDDDGQTHTAAQRASVSSIDTGASVGQPQPSLFGAEPAHTWCYYYEKADLARQVGNWDEAARLGNEAHTHNLHPMDTIEWMPFLEAYAITGDSARVNEVAKNLRSDPYSAQQACNSLAQISANGFKVQQSIQDMLQQQFCKH